MGKSNVFISHISEEEKLAKILKDHILNDFIGLVDVFVSSESIPAGNKWLEAIDEALKAAKVEIVLCSEVSVKSPWINFEVTAGWVKRIPVIPVCHTGMRPDDLPIPLKMFQAIEAKDRDGLRKVYDLLARELGSITPNADFDKMVKEIGAFEHEYSLRKPSSGWDGVERRKVERRTGKDRRVSSTFERMEYGFWKYYHQTTGKGERERLLMMASDKYNRFPATRG